VGSVRVGECSLSNNMLTSLNMKHLDQELAEMTVSVYKMLYEADPEVRPYISYWFCEAYGICIELYPDINSYEQANKDTMGEL
jgi:hypothetical protein